MEQEAQAHTSFLKRVLAFVVLVVAVAIAFKILLGFVMAVFWVIVAAAVVIAMLWALKVLIW
jgi:hypothetical protein